MFDELLKFHGSRHATSVNLMTCMGSLVIIAKLRPQLMGRVVNAIEKLNGKSFQFFNLSRHKKQYLQSFFCQFLAILPPTLERSQVQSVRKHMKAQLIGLLKHPRAVDYYDNITTLLTDLGASHHDVSQ
jgi:symplekin